MSDINPSWPPWLVVIVAVFPVVITVIGSVLVAKVNKQQIEVREMHEHIVNSHTEANLRADIDSIKTRIDSLYLMFSDLNETQKSHAKSLERRYAIIHADNEEARALNEVERKKYVAKVMGEHLSEHHQGDDGK